VLKVGGDFSVDGHPPGFVSSAPCCALPRNTLLGRAGPLRNSVKVCSEEGHSDSERVAGCPPRLVRLMDYRPSEAPFGNFSHPIFWLPSLYSY
jgi:hypothetical protein